MQDGIVLSCSILALADASAKSVFQALPAHLTRPPWISATRVSVGAVNQLECRFWIDPLLADNPCRALPFVPGRGGGLGLDRDEGQAGHK